MATLRIARVLPLVRSSAARTFSWRRGLSLLRSPMARIWMPSACISPTSESMVSPKSCIRAATSWRGRDQFSVLNAQRVRMCTPDSWPATRGRWRRRAHRPLPSMMMPTWRGNSGLEGSRIAAGAGGRSMCTETPLRMARFRGDGDPRSDLEDLSLLLLGEIVNLADEAVGDVLHLGDVALDLVLGDVPLLLQPAQVVDLVAANVAHRDARLLRLLLDELGELAAAILGQGRDGDADHLPVVAGVEPELAALESLLDGRDRAAIIRLDHQQARLGRGDPRDALQRRRRPVVVDLDAVDQRRRRPPGPDAAEVLLESLDALLHAHLGVAQALLDLRLGVLRTGAITHEPSPCASTRVPMSSPSTTRSILPSAKRSKTMMGVALSMHSVSAVLSMTSRPRLRTSMYDRWCSRVADGSLCGSAV